MRKAITFFFLLFSVSLFAQDITGTWKGKIFSGQEGDSTVFELKIHINKKKVFSGTTTQRFGVFNFATAVISVKYDSVANSLYLRERTIIDQEVWDYTSLSLSEYNLKLDGKNKMTGMMYCFITLPPKVGYRGACPSPMQVYLVKQE